MCGVPPYWWSSFKAWVRYDLQRPCAHTCLLWICLGLLLLTYLACNSSSSASQTRLVNLPQLCRAEHFRSCFRVIPQQSNTGHLHRARAKAPRVSYDGDNFASTISVLNNLLFREMPNGNSCNEFSVRLQIVLFTLRVEFRPPRRRRRMTRAA